MNVYDFDKTIYNGDSTVNFFFYCIKKRPRILVTIPRTAWYAVKYKLGICPKTTFKEQFYRFLRHINDCDSLLNEFWAKNENLIKTWYLEQKKDDDIIISASPEFLLEPICSKLNITMMASRVDKHTGEYTGVNCDGKEKIRRLYEAFPEAHVDNFYSDSHSDDPMAEIADKAIWVDGNKLSDWPK